MTNYVQEPQNYLVLDEVMADGFGIVSRKVMRAEFLTNNAKALYSYLCSFAGNGNTAFPGTETIKRELRMCKDTFYGARKELVSYGIIEVETIPTRKGARTLYKLCSNTQVDPEEAKSTHERVEAVRSSKAEKAHKARLVRDTQQASKKSLECTKKNEHKKICNTPEGFNDLEAISLKRVKSEDYLETITAYNEAVKAGFTPSSIRNAYKQYIERYKREHPDSTRYVKQLKSYLKDPDGLAFDAKPQKNPLAVIEKSPELLAQEKHERAFEEATRYLEDNDDAYKRLLQEHADCVKTLGRCFGGRDSNAYDMNMERLEQIESDMHAMKEAYLKEKPNKE